MRSCYQVELFFYSFENFTAGHVNDFTLYFVCGWYVYSLTLIHWTLEKELTKIDCMFCKVPRFYPFLVVMIMNE